LEKSFYKPDSCRYGTRKQTLYPWSRGSARPIKKKEHHLLIVLQEKEGGKKISQAGSRKSYCTT